jgi:hypothetical protein
MRESGARTVTEINASAGAFRKLAMTRDKIGVQMGLDHMPDLEALLVGCLQIHVYVPLGVNHRRDPIRTD